MRRNHISLLKFSLMNYHRGKFITVGSRILCLWKSVSDSPVSGKSIYLEKGFREQWTLTTNFFLITLSKSTILCFCLRGKAWLLKGYPRDIQAVQFWGEEGEGRTMSLSSTCKNTQIVLLKSGRFWVILLAPGRPSTQLTFEDSPPGTYLKGPDLLWETDPRRLSTVILPHI